MWRCSMHACGFGGAAFRALQAERSSRTHPNLGFLQGEDQKKLDVISNEVFSNCLRSSGRTGVIASEEEDQPVRGGQGPFVGGKGGMGGRVGGIAS